MAVKLSTEKNNDINIKVIEENGVVKLIYKDHVFVSCYTSDIDGKHYVEVRDVEKLAPVSKHDIMILAWKR